METTPLRVRGARLNKGEVKQDAGATEATADLAKSSEAGAALQIPQIKVMPQLHASSPTNPWTNAMPERDITLDEAAPFSLGQLLEPGISCILNTLGNKYHSPKGELGFIHYIRGSQASAASNSPESDCSNTGC